MSSWTSRRSRPSSPSRPSPPPRRRCRTTSSTNGSTPATPSSSTPSPCAGTRATPRTSLTPRSGGRADTEQRFASATPPEADRAIVMAIVKRAALLLLLATAAACSSSSSTKPIVESTEPRRALGTENGVRLDVELYTDSLKTNANLPLKYDITNHRDQTILVADLIPQGSYDSDTQTVTV